MHYFRSYRGCTYKIAGFISSACMTAAVVRESRKAYNFLSFVTIVVVTVDSLAWLVGSSGVVLFFFNLRSGDRSCQLFFFASEEPRVHVYRT